MRRPWVPDEEELARAATWGEVPVVAQAFCVNGGENPDQGAEQNQTTGGERFRCIEGLRGAVWRSASGNAARA